MRYFLILLLFGILNVTYSQRLGGYAVGVYNAVSSLPNITNSTDNSVGRLAYIKSTGKYYKWDVTNVTTNAGSWSEVMTVDKITGSVPPAYVPTFGDSHLVINSAGTLYTWNGTIWVGVSGGSTPTIYTDNGLLEENREVDGDNHSLSFINTSSTTIQTLGNIMTRSIFTPMSLDSALIIKSNFNYPSQLVFEALTAKRSAIRQSAEQIETDVIITLPDTMPFGFSEMYITANGKLGYKYEGVHSKTVMSFSSNATTYEHILDMPKVYVFSPDTSTTLTFVILSRLTNQYYNSAVEGKIITIRNAGLGSIVIDPYGNETIEDNLTLTLGPKQTINLMVGSTKYYIID